MMNVNAPAFVPSSAQAQAAAAMPPSTPDRSAGEPGRGGRERGDSRRRGNSHGGGGGSQHRGGRKQRSAQVRRAVGDAKLVGIGTQDTLPAV